MILNCVVVDDSQIQRSVIADLVKNHTSLNLVAEFSNAMDTIKGLNNNLVDLVFLDIEMPILNGFELLDGLSSKPQIIFLSSKTEYAYKAFNYNATDYLLKPITKDIFNKSVEKALKYHLLSIHLDKNIGEHIFVKSNLKKHKVYINNIKWIEALGDYVKLITEETNLVILSTMKAFEEKLPKNKFLRIHKSYIVNLNKIKGFSSKNVEIGSNKIPLSRNKKNLLRDALRDI